MPDKNLHSETPEITELILEAGRKAEKEACDIPDPHLAKSVTWPITCTIGPGLEGAIACESNVSYVNGSRGSLIYRGYSIFDLCAYSTYEEVSYLLLHGKLPTPRKLDQYKKRLAQYAHLPKTKRLLMGFRIEDMNAMAALRLGVNLMRQEFSWADKLDARPSPETAIASDEDSIAMETPPTGEERAIYEVDGGKEKPPSVDPHLEDPSSIRAAEHLIAGAGSLVGAVCRVRQNHLPLEPRADLGRAANLLYMMTGQVPTPLEERVMDIALILHADHGMNASTFAAMVVASTLSDVYFAAGAGIAALNGPLHGGANEQVLRMLRKIGSPGNVKEWLRKTIAKKQKIFGFGHRVYKAMDPRARVLGPIAKYLAGKNKEMKPILRVADTLEREAIARLGKKGIYPNVDYYSGMVYASLGIPNEMFTAIFAAARVSGWMAHVLEYLEHNRIFRPRAVYVGPINKTYKPIQERRGKKN